MLDTIQFEKLVRRKIASWYSTPEYEDKAVARIVAQTNPVTISSTPIQTHRKQDG